MRNWIRFCLLSLAAPAVFAAPNVLLVDSSFAPVKISGKQPFKDLCFLISENPGNYPEKGDCYDSVDWADVSKSDVDLLKGMQDHLAGKPSTLAVKWASVLVAQPDQAQRVLGVYTEAVHGSRSYSVLKKASLNKAEIIPVRNMSSISPQMAHLMNAVNDPKELDAKNLKLPRYNPECGLVKYSDKDLSEFQNSKRTLEYHHRLSKILSAHKSIQLVNLSLGYRLSWVREDNPKCPEEAWIREYEILKSAWTNFIRQHANVLFVVAAGNESENFDDPFKASDDLWASISTLPNLLLVGAMRRGGDRYDSSNFGKLVEVTAIGEGIPANSPLPGVETGYPTELRGTSFSAPVVTGQAVGILRKFPKMGVATLKKQLIKNFLETRKTLVFESLNKHCGANKNEDACLSVLASLVQTPGLLWDDTAELFLIGKAAWEFAPFPMAFDPSTKVSGQIKMFPVKDQMLPGLILSPKLGVEELLLTLHHEIYHFASMREAFNDFYKQNKVEGCVSPYQLALLKDETPAYIREYQFYEKSPKWFKKALSKVVVDSRLFGSKMNLEEFYRNLDHQIKMDKKFIVRRYVELGQYPKCAAALLKSN